jgi:hypothetical protein
MKYHIILTMANIKDIMDLMDHIIQMVQEYKNNYHYKVMDYNKRKELSMVLLILIFFFYF